MLFTHNPFPRSHLETGSIFIRIPLEARNVAGARDIHFLLASDKCRVRYVFTPVSLHLGGVSVPSPLRAFLAGVAATDHAAGGDEQVAPGQVARPA